MKLQLICFFSVLCANFSICTPIDHELQKSVIECDKKNNELRKTIEELRMQANDTEKSVLRIKNADLKIQNDQLLLQVLEFRKELSICGDLLTHAFGRCYPRSCAPLPQDHEELFQVACAAMSSNVEWTVIQRRMDGKTNFYRPWSDYKKGFGNVTGDYFVGLENLHIVTSSRAYELQIYMEDFENGKRHAHYDVFEIGGEDEKYALNKLGTYSGDAGDSLEYHKSQKFSTYDQDNDPDEGVNCAQYYKGAWWYNSCHASNLNGEYGNNKYGEGVNWGKFRGVEYSLKFVEMKIRPKV